MESISTGEADQDDLYRTAVDRYGASLERLASAYEADPEKRRDLSQDIHFQLWRSFQNYNSIFCGTGFPMNVGFSACALLKRVFFPHQEEIATDADQEPETNRDQRRVEASCLLYEQSGDP